MNRVARYQRQLTIYMDQLESCQDRPRTPGRKYFTKKRILIGLNIDGQTEQKDSL